MEIRLDEIGPDQAYFHLIQTLVPRPIAWVLTANEGGGWNLAPFSFFTALCTDPPLVVLSIGRRDDDTPKDTAANIARQGDFVIHIAHTGMAAPLNESAASLPPGVSEVEKLGLATVPFGDFSLPRLADCRIAYACSRYEIRELGADGQLIILGRVEAIHMDDSIIVRGARGRVKVDIKALDPLARLGADEYATLGEVIRLKRPA